MATQAEAALRVSTNPTDTNNNLSTDKATGEKATHRAYWKIVHKKNKEGVEIEELVIQAKAESANQANWKKLEAAGYQLLNENSFTRYTVKSETALEDLIPEASQRIYLVQSGINYVMNSKQNGFATEIQPNTGVLGADGHIIPPVPVHNNEEIDLRASINEPPGRRVLSPQERMIKEFQKYGMSPEALQKMLADAFAAYTAAQQTGAALPVPSDDEEEDDTEEDEEVTV